MKRQKMPSREQQTFDIKSRESSNIVMMTFLLIVLLVVYFKRYQNISKNYISVAQLTSHFLTNVSLSQNLQSVHTKAQQFAGHKGDFRL
jgi:hypothetical protein